MQSAAQAAKKVALYLAEHDAYPPDLPTIDVTTPGLQYSHSNLANPKYYCITATRSNVSYVVSSTQPTPSEGVCANHPQGGIGAIAPPALDSWSLSGGASYNPITGITIGSSNLTSPAMPLALSAQRVQWIDGPDQQAGVRLVLRFLREDNSVISSIQIRTAHNSPPDRAVVATPEATSKLQLQTVGSNSGSVLSPGGYLYLFGG